MTEEEREHPVKKHKLNHNSPGSGVPSMVPKVRRGSHDLHKDSSTWEARVFRALDSDGRGYLYNFEILNALKTAGMASSGRLKGLIEQLNSMNTKDHIVFSSFCFLTSDYKFTLKQILDLQTVIPQYGEFDSTFRRVFKEVKEDKDNKYSGGHVATYIPTLGRADPKWFGLAFCSTDGQCSSAGDSAMKFSMQSVSKIVAYALARELYQQAYGDGELVHKYVGDEPSGTFFNASVFDKKNRPHNPCVNAGAIMVCTLLVNEGQTVEDLQKFYMQASSSNRADIDLPLYKEESMTGFNNHALRSLMLAKDMYPKKESIEATRKLADDGLDFYFVQCSMLVDVEGLARFGAMLANNGVNPWTGQRVVSPSTVKATVTVMQMCGMYDGAGGFAKAHGCPTKSGVSGGLLTIIPGLGAFGSFSPPLNEEGNSVKGIGIIELFSHTYSNINLFHKDRRQKNVTRRPYQTMIETTIAGCEAAANNDLDTIQILQANGVDLAVGDYDKRTPLHVACTSGNFAIVKFLVERCGVTISPEDRWGATPLNDADNQQVDDTKIVSYLEGRGATRGTAQKIHTLPSPLEITERQFCLLLAAYHDDLQVLQSLAMEEGFFPDVYDYDGRTAVAIAASEGHIRAVKYLVQHKANPLITDIRGNTALADAKREQRTDVIAYLEEVAKQMERDDGQAPVF